MPPSPPHALRSRHAPWWALVAMCLVVLGPLIGQVIGQVSGQSGGQVHGHHAVQHASGDVGLLSASHTSSHANSDTSSHANSLANSHTGHATDQGIGLADACGYCSLYQHVPVLSLLLTLAALAGPIHRQGVRRRPARGHSRPAVFPQALTRAPPFTP